MSKDFEDSSMEDCIFRFLGDVERGEECSGNGKSYLSRERLA